MDELEIYTLAYEALLYRWSFQRKEQAERPNRIRETLIRKLEEKINIVHEKLLELERANGL